MGANFSNFFSIILNGSRAKRGYVDVAKSGKIKKLIFFFIKEGLILGFEEITSSSGFGKFRIFLKYDSSKPVISGIVQISSISRKVYTKITTIQRIHKSGLFLLFTTHCGYLTSFQALQKRVGGEFVCVIY